MAPENKEALVDVLIVTYNHAAFIRQALDGALNQQTDFKYRITVGDDCSTDGTTEILKEYEARFPGRMKVIYREKNLGPYHPERNIAVMLKNAKAKYIALLDGDDYWTDTKKLQRQADFLQRNPGYSICFHKATELYPDGSLSVSNPEIPDEPTTLEAEQLAFGNFLHAPTVLFRNFISELPTWYFSSPAGDYPLHMLNALRGKIMCLPESMAVYRKHPASIWSSSGELDKWERWLKVLELMKPSFTGVIKKNLDIQEHRVYLRLAELYMETHEDERAVDSLAKGLSISSENTKEWLTNNLLPLLAVNRSYPAGLKKSFRHAAKETRKRLFKG